MACKRSPVRARLAPYPSRLLLDENDVEDVSLEGDRPVALVDERAQRNLGAVREHDLVVLAAAPPDFQTSHSSRFPSKAPFATSFR